MAITSKWMSIKEALPGIGQMALVFDDKTNRISGPVRIDEIANPVSIAFKDMTWISTEQFGLKNGGVRFMDFDPTHWLPISDPPTPLNAARSDL